ncbi:hypothetical protein OQX63_17270 [Pedobacter sp. PF22-3]|uniref:hypothetical protein n=1 Tax=Pedobacter sp. PF22-3 TaxID=2994467 RepID=UPI002246ADB1|nr:hypothetical protein [Pedobacter sp. PF22-3]MCX2495244.1 hypothetical protein [Pedobacter sp. PF22-3]
MTEEEKIKSAEKYLDLFDLGDNQYIIGIYQKGVTIHDQQIRALNIFYCLHLLGKIKKGTRIGIIGGGFAGLTFAAAALNSKVYVSLFEKHGVLLPLQSGCNRVIHPNIYNFPSKGSTDPKTDLPVLNWKWGKAEDVSTKVKKQFSDISKLFSDRKEKIGKYYREILNAGKITSITFDDINGYIISDDKSNVVNCDMIIYAIGFGVEKSTEYEKTDSYWLCTKLTQENIGDEEFLISGLGDGAFMDVITSQVRDFDYDKLIDIINSDAKSETLITLLNDIRQEYFKELLEHSNSGTAIDPSYIYNEFEKINKRYYQHILDKLEFKNFKVVLHGKVAFEQIFKVGKVSLLNSFLLYILVKKRTGSKQAIGYKHGKFKYDKDKRTFKIIGDKENHSSHTKYFRYGTNKEELLTLVDGLDERVKKAGIKEKQEKSIHDGNVQKLWENDGEDYEVIFKSAWYDDIPKISGNALQCLETYTRLLATTLKQTVPEKTNFRLTMHKIYEDAGILYYQQITPYYGSELARRHGGYGRIFGWDVGSVGYSILKSEPLLILRKNNDEKYEEILADLNLDARTEDLLKSKKKSFFTFPILGRVEKDTKGNKTTTQKHTNFVLYLDSEDEDFFSHEKVFEVILGATISFVEAFESLIKKRQITVDKTLNPYTVLNSEDKKSFKNIGEGNLFGDNFKPYETFKTMLKEKDKMLVFNEYYSLSYDKN